MILAPIIFSGLFGVCFVIWGSNAQSRLIGLAGLICAAVGVVGLL